MVEIIPQTRYGWKFVNLDLFLSGYLSLIQHIFMLNFFILLFYIFIVFFFTFGGFLSIV